MTLAGCYINISICTVCSPPIQAGPDMNCAQIILPSILMLAYYSTIFFSKLAVLYLDPCGKISTPTVYNCRGADCRAVHRNEAFQYVATCDTFSLISGNVQKFVIVFNFLFHLLFLCLFLIELHKMRKTFTLKTTI